MVREYPGGYWGKILRVNLTEKKIKVEALPGEEILRRWIGGRGLGVWYMLEEVDPKINPLNPENKLFILTGPITATGYPTSGRWVSVTKSPLTDTVHDSNAGGNFGAQLKQAGFDGIIIEGASDEPLWLWIHDGEAELRSAKDLWGRDTRETTLMIRENLGDKNVSVLAIGPAGENKVLFAALMADWTRAAARGGHGAVLGAKKLKAIAVKGTQRVPLKDRKKFVDVLREHIKMVNESPVAYAALPELGTAMAVNIINEAGFFPVENFRYGYHELADNISGETLAATILIGRDPCAYCPIQCGRHTKVTDEKYKGEGGGPEYETIGMLGGNLGIFNIKAVAKANYMANELGMDTIELGGTLGVFFELYERGLIKDSDLEGLNGLKPTWGNEDAVLKLIELIAYRRGIGKILADGAYRLAARYNMTRIAPTVRKQTWAAYDPRGAKGQALSYATSNRGGCHLRGYMIKREVFGLFELLDRFSEENKAKPVIYAQNLKAVVDSMIVCEFLTYVYELPYLADALNAVTGWNITVKEFLRIGERIYNAERMFNVRSFGDGKKYDTLPERFLKEPLPRGFSKGQTVHLERMLGEYYRIRGWKEGRPTKDKIRELGLEKYMGEAEFPE